MAASSVLERARSLHEDIELLEKAIIETLENKPKPHREALRADLKVSAYTSQIQSTSAALLALYEDGSGSRREEVTAMSGRGSATAAADMMALFYQRLEDVRGYHARHPEASEPSSVTAAGDAAAEAALTTFTGEELFGKYVDLTAAFEEACNVPGIREARTAAAAAGVTAASLGKALSSGTLVLPSPELKDWAVLDLSGYLRKLPELHGRLPAKIKLSKGYRRYAMSLASYLVSFFSRRYPLADVPQLLDTWSAEFEDAWARQLMPGWHTDSSSGNGSAGGAGAGAGAGGADGESAAASHGAAAASGAGGVAASSSSAGASTSTSTAAAVNLDDYSSAADVLAKLGHEGVKAALRARGLKQGGSGEEAAARLWAVKGLTPEQYPKKLRATAAPAATAASGGDGSAAPSAGAPPAAIAPAPAAAAAAAAAVTAVPTIDLLAYASARYGGSPAVSTKCAAWFENAALRAAELLESVLQDSRRRLDKRATRTYAENAAEREAELQEVTAGGAGAGSAGAASGLAGSAAAAALLADAVDDDDEDGEGKPVYNPLNIPLGWDGKPIPYWLYKLHGLNVEYGCEICGGEKYKGRRDFDRHFQEWRHAQGMRALGIPNTKHFHDITKIADAQALYAKIKGEIAKGAAHAHGPGDAEEFEDSLGNVLSKKTYMDLQKAGLL